MFINFLVSTLTAEHRPTDQDPSRHPSEQHSLAGDSESVGASCSGNDGARSITETMKMF